MRSRFFLLFFVSSFLITLKSFSQEVYHLKAEQVHGLVPEYYQTQINQTDQTFLNDKITIHNSYLREYVLSLSYDRRTWYRVSLRKLNYAMFRLNRIYARILSTDGKKFESTLNMGKVYSLTYNTTLGKWVLVLEEI